MARSLAEHSLPNELHRVADGELALEYLLRRGDFGNAMESPRPDLILLDLRLPKLDGLEVLRRIKESEGLKLIPIVILTTSDAEQDVARAYALQANCYLVKPVNFAQFSELIESLGRFWLEWNQSP